MSNENIHTTPTGLANYCYLNRPDTTFNKDGGTYQTNLTMSREDAEPLIAVVTEAYNESQIEHKKQNKGKKKAPLPFKENEDGDIEFKFSQKAIIRTKDGESFKKTVAILDSKNKPCKANIGRGTSMKVAFEPVSYYHPKNGCGVTLRLKAVKIVDLVEYEGGEEYAFEDVEGGFEGTEELEAAEDNDWDEGAIPVDEDTGEDDENIPF